MPLPVGAEVVIAAIGNKRGVVVEAGHDGQYRVRVGSVTIACRERDLAVQPAGSKKRGRTRTPPTAGPGVSTGAGEPAGAIDLHGLTVEEAMARVEHAIDHALRRGAERLDVMHGKGTGRIRHALHRLLTTLPVVASFELDPRNAGITRVYF